MGFLRQISNSLSSSSVARDESLREQCDGHLKDYHEVLLLPTAVPNIVMINDWECGYLTGLYGPSAEESCFRDGVSPITCFPGFDVCI